MIKISVVSPVYMAEPIVDELVSRLHGSLQKITSDYEIILIEDGSPDKSWDRIVENCKLDSRVKAIKLSRNFGQHYAVTAGIQFAKGDNIVIMDCDLQDDPRNIAQIYDKINEGYDIVFTRREKRQDLFLKKVTTNLYNVLFTLFSDDQYALDNGTMVIFTNKVKLAFLDIKDQARLYIQLLKWLGFRSCSVTVTHNRRFKGETTYSFRKLIRLGLIGWTSFSNKLLNYSIYLGIILALGDFLVGLIIVLLYFFKDYQPGWPSLFVAILFSTGLILLSIGVTGIYIGKIFNQVKQRPLFIVQEKVNL